VRELWVICHFPAEDPPGILRPGRRRELRGADQLIAKLAEFNVPILQLHGHHHWRWLYRSPEPPHVLYVNAGAPMMRHGADANATSGFGASSARTAAPGSKTTTSIQRRHLELATSPACPNRASSSTTKESDEC
jgi:hypothetical protein